MIQSYTLPMSCLSGLGLSLLLGGHCSCQSLLLAGEGVTDMPPSSWNNPSPGKLSAECIISLTYGLWFRFSCASLAAAPLPDCVIGILYILYHMYTGI